jgi:hypothetical protein
MNQTFSERFLVDCCADRTVLSAAALSRLGVPAQSADSGLMLQGIGGQSPFVEVSTSVEFVRDDGGPALVHGTFAAFTEASATDLSILGRDILNNFDVIISRPRNEVILLAPAHCYRILKT